jgi:Tol biopolymer transport system component
VSLLAGARLGPYEILSPLGTGGMGEVYRARDTRLSREVAIKVLPAELSSDAERLKRFEKEARSASSLNHPNIVTIYDIGSEGGVSWIAMERVEGTTLRELLVGGALSLKKLFQIAPQIAEGLAKAHEAGIVHRDLKPENVMVSKDGFVKILDFGLAKLTSRGSGSDEGSQLPTMTQTTPGVVVGTVAYMSPEQASGLEVDFRSDQFSLGSILYELATGQKAFGRKTPPETMAAIIREEPEPIGKLRPELPLPAQWIVERCLEKEPEGRYVATRDLARDLSSLRDRLSEASSRSGAVLAVAARPRRRALPLVLALAIAAALLAGWAARGLRSVPRSAPRFTRLTFRLGGIHNARFAPDGQTVVYGASWVGDPPESLLYRTRIGSPESARFDFPGDILAISPSNEMAILQDEDKEHGVLARVPMTGGTPRQVLENVDNDGADFSPDGKELAVAHIVGLKQRLECPIGKVLVDDGVCGNLTCGVRFARDGRSIAFFVHEPGGSLAVAVIDRHGGTKRVLSGGWGDVTGAPCWSTDDNEIWFTASERAAMPPSLWAVTLSGKRRLLTRVPGYIELDDVSSKGRALLGHGTDIQTVRFSSVSQPGERELSWLDKSEVADLSADGKTILLDEVGEGSESGESIYLRGTDGSPAERLGEGRGFALSPDGKWVLAESSPPPRHYERIGGKLPSLVLIPTGPGETRTLTSDEFVDFGWGGFFPDGKSIVFSAEKTRSLQNVAGQRERARVYVQAIPNGKPRPITGEGLNIEEATNPVSPDGKYVVAVGGGKVYLVPSDGNGQPRALAGLSPFDSIEQWSSDSRHVYVFHWGERPMRVFLYDVETGQRQLWKEIPYDSSLDWIWVRMTPTGNAWAYWGQGGSGELYLVDGLS